MSRAAVFLTVLSASIIAMALVADATGFGPETMTLALVLLPIVFLLGLLVYARLAHRGVAAIVARKRLALDLKRPPAGASGFVPVRPRSTGAACRVLRGFGRQRTDLA